MHTPKQPAPRPSAAQPKALAKAPTHPRRSAAELGWTVGLDLQRAWGIRSVR